MCIHTIVILLATIAFVGFLIVRFVYPYLVFLIARAMAEAAVGEEAGLCTACSVLAVCSNCRFSLPPHTGVISDYARLKCRRYPPQPNSGVFASPFPLVATLDWCGEWKENRNASLS